MELPAPGHIFQRKYKLQEILGRGGFAAVYRATDIEIGRDVAIKMLAPGDDGYESGVASRFMREARVIASLQDPHTITMFDFGKSDEGLLFMVFEYVRGQDLSHLIRKSGPMMHEDVIHILGQVLQALREAHGAGVLHRDIKPANVLVYDYMGDSYRVKLLDFGIAKPVTPGADDPEGGINITRAGALVGTPRYMSPEQIYGGDLTASSDLYSLGLVAHEMLVGRPAIVGSSTKEMILAQLSDQPVRLPMNVRASPGLRRVIDKMTAREPEQRFASAEEVLRALDTLDLDYVAPAGTTTGSGPRPLTDTATRNPTGGGHSPNTLIEDVSSSQFYPDITPQPTLEEQRKAAVGNLAIVALGLAVGAGVVVMLILMSSKEQEWTPPPPQTTTQTEYAFEDDAGNATATPAKIVDKASNKKPAKPLKSGCGDKPRFTGEKYVKAKVGFSERAWATHVPRDYDPNKKYPIVLLFHETTKSGTRILNDTRLGQLADKEGFIVVAPDARDNTRPWYDDADTDTVKKAIEETGKLFCVDNSKIFAVGHGAGGLIAEELGCRIPLSGVAVTGYTPEVGQKVCAPNPPIPYIHLHGNKDRYAPVKGGSPCTGGSVISLQDVEKQWMERNHCTGEREVYSKHKRGTCYTWECDAPFVTCHLDGGHDWPDSAPEVFELPNCLAAPAKYPYGETIWEFFDKHGTALGGKPDAPDETKSPKKPAKDGAAPGDAADGKDAKKKSAPAPKPAPPPKEKPKEKPAADDEKGEGADPSESSD